MTAKEALDLLERGEARGIETTLLLLRVRDRFYFSFDGKKWEESHGELIKKEFEE